MARIQFPCPKCQNRLAVEEEDFGKEVKCFECGAKTVAPLYTNADAEEADSKDPEQELQERKRLRRVALRRRKLDMLRQASVAKNAQGENDVLFDCHDCEELLASSEADAGSDSYCPSCGVDLEIPDPQDLEFGAERARSRSGRKASQAKRVRPASISGEAAELQLVEEQGVRSSFKGAQASSPGDAKRGNVHEKGASAQEHGIFVNVVINKSALEDEEENSESEIKGSIPHRRAGYGALKSPSEKVSTRLFKRRQDKTDPRKAKVRTLADFGVRWEKYLFFSVLSAVLILSAAFGVYVYLQKNEGKIIPDPMQIAELTGSSETSEEGKSELRHLSDQETKAVKSVIEGYLKAGDWRKRLRYVRQPESVKPLMEDYYRTHPDGPQEMKDMVVRWSGAIDGHELVLASVINADFQELFFTVEKIDEIYKVDWEALVEYNPMSWEEFKTLRSSTPQKFRVVLTLGEYYNFEYSDAEKHQCYKVSSREEFIGLYAYAEKDSEIFRKLNVQPEEKKLAIVSLRFAEESKQENLVEISHVWQNGWVVFENQAESLAPSDLSSAADG